MEQTVTCLPVIEELWEMPRCKACLAMELFFLFPVTHCMTDITNGIETFLLYHSPTQKKLLHMQKTITTGIAAMVLLLVMSCTKENSTLTPAGTTDESAAQLAATGPDNLALTAVKIGKQVWQKTDLATSYYRNGDKIPEVKDPNKWASLTTGAWCYYNNDPSKGKLYNWYAVHDPRGLAPKGWHVPSDSEWTVLTNFLGGYEVAGGKLKERGTAHWNDPNADATNSTGFTALPGGTRYYLGQYFDAGGYGYWWSSTEAYEGASFYRYLTYFYGAISAGADYNTNGFSVRCLRNL